MPRPTLPHKLPPAPEAPRQLVALQLQPPLRLLRLMQRPLQGGGGGEGVTRGESNGGWGARLQNVIARVGGCEGSLKSKHLLVRGDVSCGAQLQRRSCRCRWGWGLGCDHALGGRAAGVQHFDLRRERANAGVSCWTAERQAAVHLLLQLRDFGGLLLQESMRPREHRAGEARGRRRGGGVARLQLQLQGSSFGCGKRWRRGRVTVLVRQVHVLVLQYVIQLLLHASTARVLLMRRLLILEGGGCGWRRPN